MYAYMAYPNERSINVADTTQKSTTMANFRLGWKAEMDNLQRCGPRLYCDPDAPEGA